MKNEYEIRGEVTAIFINSPKYGQFEALISTNKLDHVKEFPAVWCIRFSKSNNSFYVQGSLPMKDGKVTTKFLHHWVTGVPKGTFVDHRNHDTLDNTDGNLRITDHSKNAQNRKGATANSKSGVRGVYQCGKKWRTYFMVNGVNRTAGSFDNIHDAEQAVIQARLKYMPFSNESI